MENKLLKTPFTWFTQASTLKGVGPKLTEKLSQLGIKTVGDLLLHFPHRYENRTELTPIATASLDAFVVVQGTVEKVKVEGWQKKRALITLSDASGQLILLFFHFHPAMLKKMQENTILRCFGQVTPAVKGVQMIHPEWEVIENEVPLPQVLTPIYPAVAGLSQNLLRRLTGMLIQSLNEDMNEVFWQKLTASATPTFAQALSIIHQPAPSDNMAALVARTHPAYQRLAREELLAHQISLIQLKKAASLQQAPAFKVNKKSLVRFMQQLPFELTTAQKRVWQEIQSDLTLSKPMLRLLQGDVGSGKTVIGALSALLAITNQCQVALMAPTEILAEQHFMQFKAWFEPLYRCESLTGQMSAKTKRNILENITLGLTDIVIGTHAIFQENVLFKELGLIIIDEQHRFGVKQRLALGKKGLNALEPCYPHQLIMTATPIPRTLMMSHYAHLDVSVIDCLPPSRKAINTLVIPQSRRNEVIERMKTVCASGQQVYWVCTLIEESETLQCQAALAAVALLQQALTYKVALVHGQLDACEKESIMQAFYRGEIAVLVATTVIEVGVNVPNATLMVIENPERLGLAQLHQLRGRVGRGHQESYCILLYGTPINAVAKSRLQLLRQTQDGFAIAEADLALRGPGELLGVRQTGALEFKVACLERDKALLPLLSAWADVLLQEMDEAALGQMLQRWGISQQELIPAL